MGGLGMEMRALFRKDVFSGDYTRIRENEHE